jgi:cell division protein FtsW (lipid II flippase)
MHANIGWVRRGRGHVDIGVTAAIVLILVAWVFVDQIGWWSRWPWWGKALFALAALVGFMLGVSFEESRRWPRLRLEDLQPSEPAAEQDKGEPPAPGKP